MNISKYTRLTLWVNRSIALLLIVLAAAMPRLLAWYIRLRPLARSGQLAILIGFYCCVPAVGYALWNMERLLGSILAGQVFTRSCVSQILRIRWCCLGVSLICLPAAYFYLPLIFLTVIMGFLTLVVTVLASVMEAAVDLREENDLTV